MKPWEALKSYRIHAERQSSFYSEASDEWYKLRLPKMARPLFKNSRPTLK